MNPQKEHVSMALIYLGFIITGMVYLIKANSYSEIHHGMLIKAEVYSETSCTTSCDSKNNCHTSCNNQYYVDEVFLKNPNGNSTQTCTVRRPTTYYFKGDADSKANGKKLYTKRKLYQTLHSQGTCYDEKIKRTWNIIGSIFLVFPHFLVISLVVVYNSIYLWSLVRSNNISSGS